MYIDVLEVSLATWHFVIAYGLPTFSVNFCVHLGHPTCIGVPSTSNMLHVIGLISYHDNNDHDSVHG